MNTQIAALFPRGHETLATSWTNFLLFYYKCCSCWFSTVQLAILYEAAMNHLCWSPNLVIYNYFLWTLLLDSNKLKHFPKVWEVKHQMCCSIWPLYTWNFCHLNQGTLSRLTKSHYCLKLDVKNVHLNILNQTKLRFWTWYTQKMWLRFWTACKNIREHHENWSWSEGWQLANLLAYPWFIMM